LEQADQLFSSGEGHQALGIYRTLVQEITATATPSDASRECFAGALGGQIRASLRFGDHPLAEKSIQLAESSLPKDATLRVLAGNYFEYRGELEKAEASWRKAIEAKPDCFEARYQLAELDQVLSSSPERTAPYRWFLDQYNQQDRLPLSDLEWVGRACVRLEKYEWDGAQKAYKEALDASPAFSVLEAVLVAKGDLWLDRYDEQAALDIYSQALRANKESLPALLGVALAHREKGDFASCKRALDRALALNPHHPTALALSADLSFYDQQYQEGRECLDRGFETNPIDLSLLAVEEAYAIKRRQSDAAKEVLEKVRRACRSPFPFYYELAECLERNYLFREADSFHAMCLAAAPGFKRSLAARAMLASRISPASAEAALGPMKKAFSADPFHVRLHNMGELFARREGFARLESEHFVVRMPQGAANSFGGLALETLESTYEGLSRKFEHAYSGKTLVEFYDDPTDFSLRIAGLPGTGLAGVCFGDMVILMAPQRSRFTALNWGNNLRHELAHTFSLALSELRTPRWYTEGLSVEEEWDPGTASDSILAGRYQQKGLIPVENLDLSFHRPENSAMVAMAYTQSGEVVKALTGHLGFSFHLKLLRSFAQGLSTEEALPEIAGVSLEEILGWTKQRVIERLKSASTFRPLELQEDIADGSVAASSLSARDKALVELDQEAGQGRWKPLVEKADAWLAEHPGDLPFLEARAIGAYRAGEKREARKAAEAALAAASDSYSAHLVLGWLDRDNRRFERAAEHFMAAYREKPRFVAPGSPLREVEEIWRKRHNNPALADVLEKRLAMQPNDARGFLELATLAKDLGHSDLARASVRQAAFIDPYSPETQIAWGNQLLADGDAKEALDRFAVASESEAHGGRARLGMARAFLASGSAEAAVKAASEALLQDPTLEEAREISGQMKATNP
jgi:tetratricopeptide (TPR) repeat protein